jgi:hypothetical protein
VKKSVRISLMRSTPAPPWRESRLATLVKPEMSTTRNAPSNVSMEGSPRGDSAEPDHSTNAPGKYLSRLMRSASVMATPQKA